MRFQLTRSALKLLATSLATPSKAYDTCEDTTCTRNRLVALCRCAFYVLLCISWELTAGRAASVNPGKDAGAAVKDCYNRRYNATPTTFEDFLKGRPSSLRLHKVFWSQKAPSLHVTVFAGATVSRLDALESQCRSWQGPHASAVYLPLLFKPTAGREGERQQQLSDEHQAQLDKAVVDLQALFVRLEREPSACSPRMLLLYELVSEPALQALLPINLLRNAALLAVSTPLAAMVDVDLLLSNSTSAILASTQGRAALDRQLAQGSVVVLPAFETAKRLPLQQAVALAQQAAAGGKAALQPLLSSGQLHYFAEHVYKRGHSATNYAKWVASDAFYNVEYEPNYEPWFICSRLAAPLYDVRFRGYGWNKVAQVAHVNASGTMFLIHPQVYLVHRPHPKSSAQALYTNTQDGPNAAGRAVPLAKLFHRKVSALRHVVVRDQRRGTYTPATDPQSDECRRLLQWWAHGA